jgi:hypothetical protein
MYRPDKNLDIKLRLSEINRRFAELKAVSSKLAGSAEQLSRLRKVDERICLFVDRSGSSSHRRYEHPSKKPLANSRPSSRESLMDEH